MMSRRVVVLARATANLESIYRYIARKSSPRIALAYVTSIREACDELSVFAERGTEQTEARPGVRTIGFKRSATIVFRVTAEEVLITNVFYRGIDLRKKL